MFQVKENCKLLKTKLQQHFTTLSTDNLDCGNGRKETLIQNLQQNLGKTNQELREIILNFFEKLGD